MYLEVIEIIQDSACAIFSLDKLHPIPMASDVFVTKSLWGRGHTKHCAIGTKRDEHMIQCTLM